MRGRWHGRPCLLEKNVKGTVRNAGQMAWPTVPLAKKRQRHGRNRRLWVVRDRAFCKKASKARSKPWVVGHRRPCLLEKNVKGTVEIARQMAQATVPFGKKRQRHGQNWRLWVVCDRAFCKKTSKARSKSAVVGRRRPCLLQKSVKGTVKIARQMAQATVPFVKKRQRHGQNWRLWVVCDRAFCKKTSKARSKSAVEGCSRPCLLQKNDKGTVEIGGCGV